MPKSRLPGFLVVGAPKSGTATLQYLLKRHKDIFLPEMKETHFLSTFGADEVTLRKELDPWGSRPQFIKTVDEYKRLFCSHKLLVGEITPSYMLRAERVIHNMEYLYDDPRDVKIIFILRNPVFGAVSHYHFQKDRGVEDLGFFESMEADGPRGESGNYRRQHITTFNYYPYLKAFQDYFNHVKVMLAEELFFDANRFMRELFLFLGVTKGDYIAEKVTKNASLSGYKKKVDQICYLIEIMQPKIAKLNDLGIDTSNWESDLQAWKNGA